MNVILKEHLQYHNQEFSVHDTKLLVRKKNMKTRNYVDIL